MIRSILIPGRPVSVNHMYRDGVGRNNRRTRFLTTEGKLFKQRVVASFLEKYGRRDVMEGRCLILVVYRWRDRRRRDVTNYDKALLDALSGLAFVDDSQIIAFTGVKQDAMECENTEVHLYSLEDHNDYVLDIQELCRNHITLRASALCGV